MMHIVNANRLESKANVDPTASTRRVLVKNESI